MGLANYIKLFTPDANGIIDIIKYTGNTVVLWLGGAIPQIVIALLLAIFFTCYRLNIKGQQFFKTVMGKVYMFILLAILPVVIVYIFLSKSIIKGVTAGSVKG